MNPPASLAPRNAASMTPGPPPVMTVNPRRASAGSDLPRQLVVGIAFDESRRAENRDARPDEVQRAEALDELHHDPENRDELFPARARPFEEEAFGRRRVRFDRTRPAGFRLFLLSHGRSYGAAQIGLAAGAESARRLRRTPAVRLADAVERAGTSPA